MLRTTTKMLIGLSRQSYSSKMLSRQYCHRLIESLDKTAKNKMFSTQPKKPSSSFSIGSALGVLATGSMFAGTGWLLYKYGFKEREMPITGCYVDLSKNDLKASKHESVSFVLVLQYNYLQLKRH